MKSSFGFTHYVSLVQNSVCIVLNTNFHKIAYVPTVSKIHLLWSSNSCLQKSLMIHPNNTSITSTFSGKRKTLKPVKCLCSYQLLPVWDFIMPFKFWGFHKLQLQMKVHVISIFLYDMDMLLLNPLQNLWLKEKPFRIIP